MEWVRSRRAVLGLVMAAVAALPGCARPAETAVAASPRLPAPPTTTTTAPPTTTTLPPATTTTTRAEEATRAGRAEGALQVFADPAQTEPAETLPATTILGTPTVVLVREDRGDGWLRVALPGRPNGREGWVRSDDVVLFEVQREVVVDLDERRLWVFEDGEELMSAPVAVGGDRSPTPTGSFFVTDAVEVLQASGPWGPYALGLSARSDTVTEFNGGDGIIGIHGTNRPDSIGEAASLGCVRLHNEVMGQLWELVGVGTPVEIRA